MKFISKKFARDKHSYVFYKKYTQPSLSTSDMLQEELLEAFYHNNWNLMKDLIYQGAFINYRYKTCGETLMFYCNTIDEIKGLLDLGADINAKNKNGQSVLGHAIRRYWNINLIKLLLKCGAHVNVQGPFGFSPLGLAVVHQTKNLELIKLMMKYKANVNGTDKYNPHKPIGDAMTDENCTKILVKYGVLHHAESDCRSNIKIERRKGNSCGYPEVDNYLEDCIAEVMLMKQEFVCKKVTLLEYLNKTFTCSLKIKSVIDLSKYPIYADIIEETIQKGICRSQLLKELDTTRVWTPSGQESIKLTYDSTFEIADYLDNEDLQNLIIAFN